MLDNSSERQAVGTLQISFAANISKDKLLEDFCEFLIRDGIIKLVNCDNQEIELEVHDLEYLEFDEFS